MMSQQIVSDGVRLGLSIGLSLLVGALSYWSGSLTAGGALGAVFVGVATAGVGGWEWGALVVLFFVSSSLLSRLGARYKAHLVDEQWEKGSQRDWGQVMANGGLVALLALFWWFWPAPLIWAAAVGVLATVTGDTWATEVGVLSRRQPRLITSGRLVPPGASGGVTLLGTTAALLGVSCIGLTAFWLGSLIHGVWDRSVLPAAVAGGFAGVACDSLLGATVQRIAWCPTCRAETERTRHACGAATTPLRGWRWLDNDMVNMLSSATGGLVAALVSRF